MNRNGESWGVNRNGESRGVNRNGESRGVNREPSIAPTVDQTSPPLHKRQQGSQDSVLRDLE